MTDRQGERRKGSKSSIAVSLLHRDKPKANLGQASMAAGRTSNAGKSAESLISMQSAAGNEYLTSPGSSVRRSRPAKSLIDEMADITSLNDSTQSLSTRPGNLSDSAQSSSLKDHIVSLEQSLRTFHVFEVLRSKDLTAIVGVLRNNSGTRPTESIPDGTAAPNAQLGPLGGTTVLHLAVQCADLSIVEFILSQATADIDIDFNINARDKNGNTALHLAADLGRSQIVRALLGQTGIDESLINHQGQAPIDLARNADIAQQLQLARFLYTDSLSSEIRRLVSIKDYGALEKVFVDAHVQAVLDLNAIELATEASTVQSGGTLLHEAARKRDTRLIELLLLNGADPFCCDHRGKLPQDVIKDDKTRAMLKRSPAAAAAQRGIQEKAILRSGVNRQPASSTSGIKADGRSLGKDAREMKGYLKKWTNYTSGYKLRWFVLEDGVLSYYKHQNDAGSACRGAINMKIAAINMDPYDNQRFEIHGKSSVKYHLKASHVVEAKRWFWTLNNAIQWSKDEAKGAERRKAREGEILQHKIAEQTERRSSIDPESASTSAGIAYYGDSDFKTGSSDHILSHVTQAPIQHQQFGRGASDISQAPSIAEDVGRDKSRMDASVADEAVDDEEFVDDASLHSVRPVTKDALDITVHSIGLQLDLLSQVTSAFQFERSRNPEMPISTPAVMQAFGSYEAAVRTLRSLVDDLLKISKDRDAYWQYRVGREVGMRRLWEESMATIAKEQIALEGKIGESEDKRRKTKKALREALQSLGQSDFEMLPTPTPKQESQQNLDGAVTDTGQQDSTGTISQLRATSNTFNKQALMEYAYEPDTDDDDEFFDASDAGDTSVVKSPRMAGAAFLAQAGEQNHNNDETESSRAREIKTSFRGYEESVRHRLKLDADDRPKISLWGVLKSMIGKDMTRMTLPVSFNEPTSLLQRVAEDMEYTDLLDIAASRASSAERMVYIAGFAASEYASTIGRVAKPFNPLLGETFEYARPDKGYRFFVEQVSHHPPIGAVCAESANWDYYGESAVRSKFYGKSFEFSHLGTWFLKLRTAAGGEELYSWKKVNASVVGIITNNPTVDNYGPMVIKNWTTGEIAQLDFKQRGWRAAGAYEVKGKVVDAKGQLKWSIAGHWNDRICARYAAEDDIDVTDSYPSSVKRSNEPNSMQSVVVWQANVRPQGIPFNLTPFVITLNALPEGLRPLLPRTDTRLRPDQRAMEDGEYDLAAQEKNRVEEKQRAKRREREERGEDFVPKWFSKSRCSVTGEGYWLFDGRYWKMRDSVANGGAWEGPEDIF